VAVPTVRSLLRRPEEIRSIREQAAAFDDR
jgi:hypothetical protein